jgi:glycosyltransferase involved in cell wall biosynthesis
MERLTIFASFPTTPLTDCVPNGDGLVAYHFLEALALRGHRLHVATPQAELRRPFPGDVCVYEMNRTAQQSRRNTLAYMRWTRQTLQSIRRTERIDLIHELNPVFVLRSLAFAGCGLPVVLGPHSSRWQDATEQQSFVTRIQRRTMALLKDVIIDQQHRRASAILLSTLAALNNVRNPEERTDSLFVLPPGLNTDEFSPASECEQHAPTILFLANVLARKGIFTLLDAFSILTARMPQAKLLIAGGGPDLAAVQQRIAAASFRSQVIFTGRVDRAQVPDLMRRCTVYCLPSQGEPFGMTILEAMACGKPLVVTDAGGPACMVSDAGGRRVPVGDAAHLAEALQELLSQPELCRQMGQHNRSEVERKYAWPVVAERLENIYRSVLGAHSQAEADRVTTQQIAAYRQKATGSLKAQPASMTPLRPGKLEAQL